MTLKPFWAYYGGKYRAAPHYPAPLCDTIVEPFAGAAGYATRYPDRQVVLVDRDPVIAGLWDYLIHVSEAEVLALPDVHPGEDVAGMRLPPEATWLIGFWLNKGCAAPARMPSAWMRQGAHVTSFWGETIRRRIASQVGRIRHWKVVCGDYWQAPDVRATWFVDPPYAVRGCHYRACSADIDYAHLGGWCRRRQGQVVVCENEGATWLPFRPFRAIKANESRGGGKVSREAIWTGGDHG